MCQSNVPDCPYCLVDAARPDKCPTGNARIGDTVYVRARTGKQKLRKGKIFCVGIGNSAGHYLDVAAYLGRDKQPTVLSTHEHEVTLPAIVAILPPTEEVPADCLCWAKDHNLIIARRCRNSTTPAYRFLDANFEELYLYASERTTANFYYRNGSWLNGKWELADGETELSSSSGKVECPEEFEIQY